MSNFNALTTILFYSPIIGPIHVWNTVLKTCGTCEELCSLRTSSTNNGKKVGAYLLNESLFSSLSAFSTATTSGDLAAASSFDVAPMGRIQFLGCLGHTTAWIPMARNWGQNWHSSLDLIGQSLSFEVTLRGGKTIASYDVAPPYWRFGMTYQGKQFHS
ncbi:PREDICTED: uncharacterized protein LOC104733062 [Camelina sativa]|uniref:Uncharacterized protein LOC104733062 n=1 Tax=Camelina sativa TaxID=90675 RepID=A0ABM0V5B5_CAMSA|nr:PREDICTED: uncharacterized protein LOC104733062 [Camelina sativa]